MQKQFAILIRPDTNTVHDVNAFLWTHYEMRQILQVGTDELAERQLERTGDSIFVSAYLNATVAGEASRCEGFYLHGDRYFGPALIVSGTTNGTAPMLDPHDVSRAIQFFRLTPESTGAHRHRSMTA